MSTTTIMKILIADDEPLYIAMLKGLLPQQHKYMAATDGMTALELAKRHQPDLILLDVRMPEMNGYEVCLALKENPCTTNIPVIFLTSMDATEDVVKGFNLGAVDYITKPFNSIELNSRVTTQLQLQAAKAELIRMNAELQEQQKLFLEMIPHDMRTSLAIVNGNAELLQCMVKKRVAENKKYGSLAGDILHGCERMKTLFTDLLDIGRIKAGLFKVHPTAMSIKKLLSDILSVDSETIEIARYRFELLEDLPEAMIDHNCMDRVLLNLLTTIEKYSDPGSTIIIRAWQRKEVIVVAICAEGEKLSSIDQEKFFVPYYWSYQNNTTEGIGLGLHIAKLLVEAQSGQIWVDFDDESKNRYCFTIPIWADRQC